MGITVTLMHTYLFLNHSGGVDVQTLTAVDETCHHTHLHTIQLSKPFLFLYSHDYHTTCSWVNDMARFSLSFYLGIAWFAQWQLVYCQMPKQRLAIEKKHFQHFFIGTGNSGCFFPAPRMNYKAIHTWHTCTIKEKQITRMFFSSTTVNTFLHPAEVWRQISINQ